jgi:hypothetical protein
MTYVFKGPKEYGAKQVQGILGLAAGVRLQVPQPSQPGPSLPPLGPTGRLLMPVSEAEFNITSILEASAKYAWPVANDWCRAWRGSWDAGDSYSRLRPKLTLILAIYRFS